MKRKYEYELRVTYASGLVRTHFVKAANHVAAMIRFIQQDAKRGSAPFAVEFTGNYQSQVRPAIAKVEGDK